LEVKSKADANKPEHSATPTVRWQRANWIRAWEIPTDRQCVHQSQRWLPPIRVHS